MQQPDLRLSTALRPVKPPPIGRSGPSGQLVTIRSVDADRVDCTLQRVMQGGDGPRELLHRAAPGEVDYRPSGAPGTNQDFILRRRARK
jgi:hypothetical protein